MKRKIRITTPQLFACGFALIILLGAAALALPFASRDGHSIPFLNALFTACSATCVTGLSVYDVWTQFSGFGQAVLLLLIQLGGLGFMSFAALIALAAGRRIGLKERMELSAPQFLIGCALDFPLSGKALQRRMIVGMLALRTLFGTSGDFYNRLYGEGLLNRDYDYEIDCTAGTATFMLGGESPDPKRVLKELCDALSEVKVKGLSPNAFERAKKASFGARLRGLEDFDNLCIALTESALSDYCSLDSFSLLSEITVGECEEFLIQNIDPDRLALSVLLPNEVTK